MDECYRQEKLVLAAQEELAAEKKISEQWAKTAEAWKEKAERLAKAVVDAVADQTKNT